MMSGRRLVRFVFVFLLLTSIWLLLSGKWDAFHVGWGIAGALYIAALDAKRSPERAFPVGRFLAFVPWHLYQILVSNLRVAKLVLRPDLPIRPRVLRKKPGVEDPWALTVLGCSITLTPGTLTIDIDRQEMVVHALDDDSAQDIEEGGLARRVQHIFGAPILPAKDSAEV